MPPIDLKQPGGARAAAQRIRDVAAAMGPEGGDPVLRHLTFIILREMRLELSRPGSGRIYKRGKGRTHTASAPGEPPAVDTGELRNSIDRELFEGVGYVGTPLAYGRYLEYGTIDGGGFIAPRPWVRTVVDRLPELIAQELPTVAQQAVTVAIGKVNR